MIKVKSKTKAQLLLTMILIDIFLLSSHPCFVITGLSNINTITDFNISSPIQRSAAQSQLN